MREAQKPRGAGAGAEVARRHDLAGLRLGLLGLLDMEHADLLGKP